MTTEDSAQTSGSRNGFMQGRIKPNQARIQLPVVSTSTQTEDNFVFAPVTFQGCAIPVYVHPKDFPTSHQLDGLNHQEKPATLHPDLSMATEKDLGASDSLGMNYQHNDISFVGGGGGSSLQRQKSEISSYVLALRPWSFPASITPVALGSCLAYKSQGVFDISIFFITVFTALCVHAAGNLVNTYFDFVRGIDTKKSDDRTIVDNILSLNDIATLGAVFYIAGCVGFMVLNFLSPAKMEHLALIYFCGLSSSFLYTGGLGLKYVAMGDILIVLTFGPLTVVFSHLSQTGQLSLTPLIYAIPLALNTEAILHCNNSRDIDADKQAGIITLAILLGKTGSYFLFCLLLFLPYLIFITVGVHCSGWMLLPAASIILAFRLEKQFRRRELDHIPQRVARLNLVLGLLYICSILLSNSTSLPKMMFL